MIILHPTNNLITRILIGEKKVELLNPQVRGELREGHIRVEWRMGGECGNAISVG